MPLGVVGTKNFDRTPESLEEEKHEKRKRRTKTPIEDKESFRWLEGYRNACQLAAECPDTQVVSLADSEADIYDIFVEAQQTAADEGSTRADYVIRAHENRSTPERNREVSRRTWHKVFDQVQASPLRTRHQIELQETPQREARLATLEIRALEVQVKPPNHRPDEPIITHNMVLVQEVNGPGDGSSRARKRMAYRAKRWLNTDVVEHMTPELLSQRDPQGEVLSWLRTIGQLADLS